MLSLVTILLTCFPLNSASLHLILPSSQDFVPLSWQEPCLTVRNVHLVTPDVTDYLTSTGKLSWNWQSRSLEINLSLHQSNVNNPSANSKVVGYTHPPSAFEPLLFDHQFHQLKVLSKRDSMFICVWEKRQRGCLIWASNRPLILLL